MLFKKLIFSVKIIETGSYANEIRSRKNNDIWKSTEKLNKNNIVKAISLFYVHINQNPALVIVYQTFLSIFQNFNDKQFKK